jgi:hypothetical protein
MSVGLQVRVLFTCLFSPSFLRFNGSWTRTNSSDKYTYLNITLKKIILNKKTSFKYKKKYDKYFFYLIFLIIIILEALLRNLGFLILSFFSKSWNYYYFKNKNEISF